MPAVESQAVEIDHHREDSDEAVETLVSEPSSDEFGELEPEHIEFDLEPYDDTESE